MEKCYPKAISFFNAMSSFAYVKVRLWQNSMTAIISSVFAQPQIMNKLRNWIPVELWIVKVIAVQSTYGPLTSTIPLFAALEKLYLLLQRMQFQCYNLWFIVAPIWRTPGCDKFKLLQHKISEQEPHFYIQIDISNNPRIILMKIMKKWIISKVVIYINTKSWFYMK